MDFLKVPVKEIAALVVAGKHELGEVPETRRSNVEVEVKRLKAAIASALVTQVASVEPITQDEQVEVFKPNTQLDFVQPTDDLDAHTVAELRVIAEDYPAITQVIYLRKAELITAIRAARLNEVTQ